MKKITYAIFLSTLVIFYSIAGLTITPTVAQSCSSAVATYEIESAGGGQFAYNLDTITVGKGTCVTLKFKNVDTIFHDFKVDNTTDFAGFDINVEAETTGEITILMPDVVKDFEFYCSVLGHRAAGMTGTLKVVESTATSSPSNFSTLSLILGLFAIVVAVPLVRKFKNKPT